MVDLAAFSGRPRISSAFFFLLCLTLRTRCQAPPPRPSHPHPTPRPRTTLVRAGVCNREVFTQHQCSNSPLSKGHLELQTSNNLISLHSDELSFSPLREGDRQGHEAAKQLGSGTLHCLGPVEQWGEPAGGQRVSPARRLSEFPAEISELHSVAYPYEVCVRVKQGQSMGTGREMLARWRIHMVSLVLPDPQCHYF